MRKSIRVCLIVAFLLAPLTRSEATINTITSTNFSLGYSFIGPNNAVPTTWSTVETAISNTPTTVGDFKFQPTTVSRAFGGQGPDFPGRNLTDAVTFGVTGDSINWTNTVTASWSGTTPLDAGLYPNYQISLNITSLRIWGISFPGFAGDTNINFAEVGGLGGSSTSIVLKVEANENIATNYRHLVWSPGAFQIAGTNITRTFIVNANVDQGLDGFEVFGNVTLIYDAIPEPSVLGLAVVGVLALRRAVRRKKSSPV